MGMKEIIKYHDAEGEFTKWLSENTETLYLENKNSDFTIMIDALRKVVNEKVRLVAKLKPGVDAEFQKRFADLINLNKLTFPKGKRLPLHFPKVFSDIERITVYENDASEHIVISEERKYNKMIKWQVVKTEDADEIEEEYKKSDLTYDRRDNDTTRKTTFLLSGKSILKKLGAKKIVLKRDSGKQYRCRIKKINERTDPKRYQFGLIILTSDNPEVEIRKTRNAFIRADISERLKNEVKLELPVDTFHIFIEK